MATRNLTIMFTDIKGFTERVSQSSRGGLERLQALHEKLLPPVFHYFDGHIVKTIGDAFLVYFESPTNAVQCGVAIQSVLRKHNAAFDASSEDYLEVRVAINSGEVYFMDNDILGEPVNIAARLEGIAEAGEVYFTESTYLAMNRTEAPSAEVGEKIFKGISYPVRVYRAVQDPHSEMDIEQFMTELVTNSPKNTGANRFTSQISRKSGWAAAVLILASFGGLAYYLSAIYPVQSAQREAVFFAEVGDYDKAISMVDKAMNHQYLRSESMALAIDYANKRVKQFEEPDEALVWIRKNLVSYAYLAPIQSHIAELEKQNEVMWLKNNPNDKEYFTRYFRLLDEYPKDPDLPLLMEKELDKQLSYNSRLKLFLRALDNGAPNEPRIFDYLVKIFTHTAAEGWSDPAYDIALKYYPDQARQWAVEKADGDHGQQFMAAWRLLTAMKHPYVDDVYYQQLRQLLRGYDNEQEANAALEHFKSVDKASQQAQVLAFHQWVFSDDKQVESWSYRGKNHTENNHKQLMEHYGL